MGVVTNVERVDSTPELTAAILEILDAEGAASLRFLRAFSEAPLRVRRLALRWLALGWRGRNHKKTNVMNPDSVLRTLVGAALRDAVYKILFHAPVAVSWLIVGLALAYALMGHR